MEEEARRAIDDALSGEETHEHYHMMRRIGHALAGVVDRHKEESFESHERLRQRIDATNKLAISIGTGVLLTLVTAVVTIWFRL